MKKLFIAVFILTFIFWRFHHDAPGKVYVNTRGENILIDDGHYELQSIELKHSTMYGYWFHIRLVIPADEKKINKAKLTNDTIVDADVAYGTQITQLTHDEVGYVYIMGGYPFISVGTKQAIR
jgi:hypothetical protein